MCMHILKTTHQDRVCCHHSELWGERSHVSRYVTVGGSDLGPSPFTYGCQALSHSPCCSRVRWPSPRGHVLRNEDSPQRRRWGQCSRAVIRDKQVMILTVLPLPSRLPAQQMLRTFLFLSFEFCCQLVGNPKFCNFLKKTHEL